MAYERYWEEVSPRLLSTNGTSDGSVGIADLNGFYVKQDVVLQSNTLPATTFQIKRIDVVNSQVWLGSKSEPINKYSNLSAFLVSESATIQAARQPKNSVPKDDQAQGTYETEPVVARRVVLVDGTGQKYTQENPLPVDATVSVVVPPLEVELDALTPPDQLSPDNVLIAGSEDGTKTGLKHAVRVDSDLDLRVGISDGNNKASVDNDGKLSVTDVDTQAAIADVITQLQAGGIILGTEDGTVSGTPRVFVNNLKTQILDSADREANFTYADFGTKDQRVTRIEYTSDTFPGVIVRRDFSYTLVGSRYRRDNEIWNII